MPKFLCTHTLPPKAVTLDQVKQVGQASQADKTVKGLHSYGNLAEGKIACIFEGPDRESVASFFESKGMPYDSIIRMDFEGDHGNVMAL